MVLLAGLVIMTALGTILYTGVRLVQVGARLDRGQPWAPNSSLSDGRTERHRMDMRTAPKHALPAETELDPEAAVQQAVEIVSAAHRANS